MEGSSPAGVRVTTPDDPAVTPEAEISQTIISEPKLVSLYGKYIVGLEVRTTNQDEMDPKKAKIPGVWERVYKESLTEHIPGQKEPGVKLGAYTRYQSDGNGPYSLIVGAEVGDVDDVPEGMAGIVVLAQEYLIFMATGEMPQAAIDGWGAVWKYFAADTTLQRAFTTDFERYDDAKPGIVEIHIAVR
ncbi:MAG: GyrI-like domain-containing protein [Gemmatimonadaceae bacterium]